MFFTFPDQFVFWHEMPKTEHLALKEKLLPQILQREDEFRSNPKISSWDADLSCSIGHKLDFLLDPHVIDMLVWSPMDKMVSENKGEIYKVPLNSTLENVWFNVTNPGEFQEVHHHVPASFSGIYLLDCDEPNPTSFYRPSSRKESFTLFTTEFMKEGTVILFPSDLSHYVKPTKKRRVTLAFNVFCTY